MTTMIDKLTRADFFVLRDDKKEPIASSFPCDWRLV